jgi:hypothetical protein
LLIDMRSGGGGVMIRWCHRGLFCCAAFSRCSWSK